MIVMSPEYTLSGSVIVIEGVLLLLTEKSAVASAVPEAVPSLGVMRIWISS